MLVSKNGITIPAVKSETVNVPDLGGEVEVRGILLKDRLLIAGQTEPGGNIVALTLAATVHGAEGPLMSADEWERWGAVHLVAATTLWAAARRVCGMDREEVEKKSEAPSEA